jgi:hypothetical protein
MLIPSKSTWESNGIEKAIECLKDLGKFLEILGKNTRNYRYPATIEAIKSTITPITKIFLVEDFIFNLSL